MQAHLLGAKDIFGSSVSQAAYRPAYAPSTWRSAVTCMRACMIIRQCTCNEAGCGTWLLMLTIMYLPFF
jgi:hypothetical protein